MKVNRNWLDFIRKLVFPLPRVCKFSNIVKKVITVVLDAVCISEVYFKCKEQTLFRKILLLS